MTASSSIPPSLQRRVRERAQDCCEYCGIPQSGQEATFHIDHIVPRRAGGPSLPSNLALACVSCSLRKGARIDAVDPESGVIARLFNPRTERWQEHFQVASDAFIIGRTPAGRATIELLKLNRSLAVALRRELMSRGQYPPESD